MDLDTVNYYLAFGFPYLTFVTSLWAFICLRAWSQTHDRHNLTQGIAVTLAAVYFLFMTIWVFLYDTPIVWFWLLVVVNIVALSVTVDLAQVFIRSKNGGKPGRGQW